MTMIKILQYPNPHLHIKTKLVTDVKDPRLQKIIDDMFETLYNTPNCCGLAATQLDIPEPVPRVTVIDVSERKNQPICLINPEVIATEGEYAEMEGCMSVYPDDIHAIVTRAAKVKIKALNREGDPIEMEGTGVLGKCFQHEIDHLDGIVYVQRLSPLKRERIDKRIKKFHLHDHHENCGCE